VNICVPEFKGTPVLDAFTASNINAREINVTQFYSTFDSLDNCAFVC
jgi:hypothetical protein